MERNWPYLRKKPIERDSGYKSTTKKRIRPVRLNEVLRTLKASPLNSRVVHSTPGYDKCIASTLKESPNYAVGAPLQGAYITSCTVSVGAPAAYHAAIKR